MKKLQQFLTVLLVFFGITVSAQQATFTVTEPFSNPAFVGDTFFLNSNSATNDEIFIAGSEQNASVAKTYRQSGSNWPVDDDLNLTEFDDHFAKGRFNSSAFDDLLYCNDSEIKIFKHSSSGNYSLDYDEGFASDNNMSNPNITTFDYGLDGDIDGYYSGMDSSTGIIYNKILENDGNGNFIEIDTTLPASDSGSVVAGLINGVWYIVITGQTESGTQRGIYKLHTDGTSFIFMQSIPPFDDSSVNFADANGDGVNDITIMGASGGIKTTEIYELNGGNFTLEVSNSGGLPGLQGGFIDYYDFDDDGNMDAVCAGRAQSGGQIFDIRYGTGNFQFNGTIQTFTNPQNQPITFRQVSLDINDSDEVKIAVSGNLSPNAIVPRAYLLTLDSCTETTWYEDADNDGFGDPNVSLEACEQPNGYVANDDDAFPNDSNENADSDGDGVGDNGDAFPNDASETMDSDNDGVGDNADQCPDTPAGDTVDSTGCTETDCTPVNYWPDTDGDGFGDSDGTPENVCPGTEPDGYVTNNSDVFPDDPNENADADGDGLGDNADQCDDTPPGEEIDATGCTATMSLSDKNIASRIKIYPNPAFTHVNIQNRSGTTITQLTMYSLLGKRVISQKKEISSHTEMLNIAPLKSGIYILEISDGQNAMFQKIVKQ